MHTITRGKALKKRAETVDVHINVGPGKTMHDLEQPEKYEGNPKHTRSVADDHQLHTSWNVKTSTDPHL